jgi:hypothetical protein
MLRLPPLSSGTVDLENDTRGDKVLQYQPWITHEMNVVTVQNKTGVDALKTCVLPHDLNDHFGEVRCHVTLGRNIRTTC